MIIIHASYIMKYIHVSIYYIICKNTTIIIKLNAIAASIARLILRFVNTNVIYFASVRRMFLTP